MLATLVLFAAGALFTQGLAPIDTGAPAQQLAAQACAGCHAAEHAEWAASRHGRAWSNAIFQREYQQQTLAWCVHCHAPLREQLAQVHTGSGGALAADGVGCAACHLREGRMVSRTRHAGSPHDTDARADFGGPTFCAGCHQFNFPIIATDEGVGHVVAYSRYPMQDTVAQHAAGARAALPCRTCHTSPAGHAYPGGHAPAMLARALTLDVCRARGELRLRITNSGAGHNVPTGDLHRHVVLRAWRPSAPERLHETLFGRRFTPAPGGGKQTVADTTLPPAATRIVNIPVQALGGAPTDPLRVELRLVYTIDEFPLPQQKLAEPTWATMKSEELAWSSLPVCAGTPLKAQARRVSHRR
jgi:hypothetical protein